ncbi:MAG: right-handed parallel beta-helix repeat-containing protein, partial [Solirubrobacterales bacterium]
MKGIRFVVAPMAILVGLFILLPAVASATALPTKITENMTLTSAGNPYTVGEITIEEGVTVSVEPGTRLVGTGAFSRIFVKGTLKAEGSAESPVVFTSASGEEAGEWRGLVFESGSDSSVLDHVEVAYGGHLSVPMVEVVSSSPTIQNSTFRKSQNQAIYVPSGGSPNIGGNSFYSNGSTAIQYTGPK